MSIHIYKSVKPGKVDEAGRLVWPPNARMNYKGECGPTDDPKGYARMQARLGYRIVIVGERCPDEQPPDPKRQNFPQGPAWATLSSLESML